MRRRKVQRLASRRSANIDLTSMMDLTFILLITFVITFPLIEQGIPVNLPQGSADEISHDDSRAITIDKTGTVYLDNVQVSMEALSSEMQTFGRASPEGTVQVRADQTVVYGKLVDVMKILHDAKISKLALVTQAN